MKILLITSAYPPEVRSSSVLFQEMAEALSAQGHEVSVLTPAYKRLAPHSVRSIENGVFVYRVPSLPLHYTGPIRRGFAYLWSPVTFIRHGLTLDPPDVIIVYSPPLTLSLAAIFLKRRFKAKFVLNVQDLFPQNAIDLGLMKNKLAIWVFRWIERFSYRHADFITCHSEYNKKWLLAHGCHPGKTKIVHNWIAHELYEGVTSDGMRKRLHLENKFVVFFGGVMGFAQGLEVVIEAARLMQGKEETVFLLLGEGVMKSQLIEQAKGLRNIVFHPFVSVTEYPQWVAAIDVGLVTLHPAMKTPVVPSKILGYMASGKPFVAGVNRESDVKMIVDDAACGILVEAGKPKLLAESLLMLYENKKLCEEMGSRGREYCQKHFSKQVCIDQYRKILKLLVEGG